MTAATWKSLVLLVIGSAVTILWAFPVLWTFVTSLKNEIDVTAYPPLFIFEPVWGNYPAVLSGATSILPHLVTSLVVAVLTTVITMAVAVPAAYALARLRFFGRRPVGFYILATQMLPRIGFVIPFFLLFNSIGWIVGHLAYQEQVFWFERRGVPIVVPGLHNLVGFRQPASTPPLDEMWSAWRAITAAADPYLDSLTTAELETFYRVNGAPVSESIGTMCLRLTYHYWFHNGEAQAIRQLLGHTKLQQFVGNIGAEAPYRPE